VQSKNNAPTAAQKRWYGTVAEQGCRVCSSDAQVHHCVGATGKHRKINIGHEFIIPLCGAHHRELHGGETFGFDSRKEFEKNAYVEVVTIAALQGQDTPDLVVNEAIRGYHR